MPNFYYYIQKNRKQFQTLENTSNLPKITFK